MKKSSSKKTRGSENDSTNSTCQKRTSDDHLSKTFLSYLQLLKYRLLVSTNDEEGKDQLMHIPNVCLETCPCCVGFQALVLYGLDLSDLERIDDDEKKETNRFVAMFSPLNVHDPRCFDEDDRHDYEVARVGEIEDDGGDDAVELVE